MTTPTVPLPSAVLALGAGAFAAYGLVGGPVGIAFPMTAALVIAAVAEARPDIRHSPEAIAFGVLSVALVSMAAVRDAPWLIALDLLGALSLAACAVAGISSWASLGRAAALSSLNALRGPARVVVAFTAKLGPRHASLAPMARGGLIAGFLLLVFVPLLMSADQAFAQITGDLLDLDVNGRLIPTRIAVGVAVLAIAAGLALTQRRAEVVDAGDPIGASIGGVRNPFRARSEWVLPLAALDLVFVGFVVVQITVLFGGREHVVENAGVTFAEYARSGFFQLLAVAFLTLGVIAVAGFLVRHEAQRDRALLRTLLGVLCACTLVMLVSAFDRLALYEETYGFTRLRISVHATILWLAGVFALVIVAGAMWKATWLPRAFVAFTGASLLAFTLVNPEGIIAGQNVERYGNTGRVDDHYLSTLSADAVPALMELPEPIRGVVVGAISERLSGGEPWTSTNLARHRARELLEAR